MRVNARSSRALGHATDSGSGHRTLAVSTGSRARTGTVSAGRRAAPFRTAHRHCGAKSHTGTASKFEYSKLTSTVRESARRFSTPWTVRRRASNVWASCPPPRPRRRRWQGRRGRDVDLLRFCSSRPACVEPLQAGASRLAVTRAGPPRPPASMRCTMAVPSTKRSGGLVDRAQTSRTTTCSYDWLGHRARCAGAGVLCGEDARSWRVCGCDRRGRG